MTLPSVRASACTTQATQTVNSDHTGIYVRRDETLLIIAHSRESVDNDITSITFDGVAAVEVIAEHTGNVATHVYRISPNVNTTGDIVVTWAAEQGIGAAGYVIVKSCDLVTLADVTDSEVDNNTTAAKITIVTTVQNTLILAFGSYFDADGGGSIVGPETDEGDAMVYNKDGTLINFCIRKNALQDGSHIIGPETAGMTGTEDCTWAALAVREAVNVEDNASGYTALGHFGDVSPSLIGGM